MAFVTSIDEYKSFVGNTVEFVAFDIKYNVVRVFMTNDIYRTQCCNLHDFEEEPTIVLSTYWNKVAEDRPWLIFPNTTENISKLIKDQIAGLEEKIIEKTKRMDEEGDEDGGFQQLIDDAKLALIDLKENLNATI